ncbi:hypothetical protein EDB84DRAFT_1620812 [Lactarius hengduanensis]|nr:hypothetical protein EDB84DRAFT_1620812 [Lactarius hengduanensis]
MPKVPTLTPRAKRAQALALKKQEDALAAKRLEEEMAASGGRLKKRQALKNAGTYLFCEVEGYSESTVIMVFFLVWKKKDIQDDGPAPSRKRAQSNPDETDTTKKKKGVATKPKPLAVKGNKRVLQLFYLHLHPAKPIPVLMVMGSCSIPLCGSSLDLGMRVHRARARISDAKKARQGHLQWGVERVITGNAKSRILTRTRGATEDALRACCCCWSWPGVGVVGLSAREERVIPGNAKPRILTRTQGATEDTLHACCCCWSWPGVGVVGLSAPELALVVKSASGPRIAGGAGNAQVEVGREHVEERWERAAEAWRETGEGGAGREEVSELCKDLRPVESVGAVEVEGGEDGWMMVVGGFWLLARGVVGWDSERGVPWSSTALATTELSAVMRTVCDAPDRFVLDAQGIFGWRASM